MTASAQYNGAILPSLEDCCWWFWRAYGVLSSIVLRNKEYILHSTTDVVSPFSPIVAGLAHLCIPRRLLFFPSLSLPTSLSPSLPLFLLPRSSPPLLGLLLRIHTSTALSCDWPLGVGGKPHRHPRLPPANPPKGSSSRPCSVHTASSLPHERDHIRQLAVPCISLSAVLPLAFSLPGFSARNIHCPFTLSPSASVADILSRSKPSVSTRLHLGFQSKLWGFPRLSVVISRVALTRGCYISVTTSLLQPPPSNAGSGTLFCVFDSTTPQP